MNKEEIKEYVKLMAYNYTLMYVYLGDKEDILLKIASNNSNCKLYIIGQSSKISKKAEKYFETIIV